MKAPTLLAILILLPLLVIGQREKNQKLSQTVKSQVKEMAKVDMVLGPVVGYGIGRPDIYNVFLDFKEHVTDNELLKLVDHRNSAVRCYSIQVLSERDSVDYMPILLSVIGDKSLVITQFGCVRRTLLVADYMISQCAWKLDSTNWQTLDSALIFVPNSLKRTRIRLPSIPANEKYYKRIRTLSIKNQFSTAIVALAKFQKEEDVEFINSKCKIPEEIGSYYSLFAAIREFPHSKFKWFLEEQSILYKEREKTHRGIKKSLIEAIESYNDDWSKALIESME